MTLALYAASLVAVVLTGARTATYEDLEAALQRGEISQVLVETDIALPDGYVDGGEGVSPLRLVWQDGWHRSVVEIKQASSLEELRSQGFEPQPGEQIIGDVDQELRKLAPHDVEVLRTPWQDGPQVSLAGWEARGGWSLLPMALFVAFLGLIVTSPQPRLATRWAWVWLALSPVFVVAALLYLLVGARPHIPGRWRLGGFGAFLILLLL